MNKSPTTHQNKQDDEPKAFKNPSYDESLPVRERLRDFLGAYHIEYNGSTSHEPFMLIHEGKPDVRCDDDVKERITEYVENLISSLLSKARQEEREKIFNSLTSYDNATFMYKKDERVVSVSMIDLKNSLKNV